MKANVHVLTVQVLEACRESKVFKPPNPWIQGILALVAEIYALDKLKLNLKFEIEMLFRSLGLAISDSSPSSLLRGVERAVADNADFAAPAPPPQPLPTPPAQPAPQLRLPAQSQAPPVPVQPPAPAPAPPAPAPVLVSVPAPALELPVPQAVASTAPSTPPAPQPLPDTKGPGKGLCATFLILLAFLPSSPGHVVFQALLHTLGKLKRSRLLLSLMKQGFRPC